MPEPAVPALLRGLWRFGAVHALAVLGCASHLADGPLSVTELAFRCGAYPDALHRLLSCAAYTGLFAQPAPGRWELTEAGRHLMPDVPGSAHPALLAAADPVNWQSIADLAALARTGPSAMAVRPSLNPHADPAIRRDADRILDAVLPDRTREIATAVSGLRQGHHRDQTGVRHQMRVIKPRMNLRQLMQQSHLRGVLSRSATEA